MLLRPKRWLPPRWPKTAASRWKPAQPKRRKLPKPKPQLRQSKRLPQLMPPSLTQEILAKVSPAVPQMPRRQVQILLRGRQVPTEAMTQIVQRVLKLRLVQAEAMARVTVAGLNRLPVLALATDRTELTRLGLALKARMAQRATLTAKRGVKLVQEKLEALKVLLAQMLPVRMPRFREARRVRASTAVQGLAPPTRVLPMVKQGLLRWRRAMRTQGAPSPKVSQPGMGPQPIKTRLPPQRSPRKTNRPAQTQSQRLLRITPAL